MADFAYHILILAKSRRTAHIAGSYSTTTTMEDSEFEKETDQTPNIKNTKKKKNKKKNNAIHQLKVLFLSFYKYRLAKWTAETCIHDELFFL